MATSISLIAMSACLFGIAVIFCRWFALHNRRLMKLEQENWLYGRQLFVMERLLEELMAK